MITTMRGMKFLSTCLAVCNSEEKETKDKRNNFDHKGGYMQKYVAIKMTIGKRMWLWKWLYAKECDYKGGYMQKNVTIKVALCKWICLQRWLYAKDCDYKGGIMHVACDVHLLLKAVLRSVHSPNLGKPNQRLAILDGQSRHDHHDNNGTTHHGLSFTNKAHAQQKTP